ncbi:DNA/RNA non-specific endonuclease [Pseudanabaena sp. BC1403]|uniref:DNA/RNA non-specific endonuclease n=1 Tax=Pseudanabaena sp. BC1403 TaxID=2043171 RepID=UPI000CD89967|nr:DNA/RNA non-specific endonuclease [Pseudanabaena sp. BC1403]
MRSPLALLLTALLVIGFSQTTTLAIDRAHAQSEQTLDNNVTNKVTPTTVPIQANPAHTLDNDYGNPNLKAGNPSKAKPDVANADNYLMLKPEYVLSYSKSRNIANWASWQLNKSWMGEAKRQNNFRPDPALPKGWYRVVTTNYGGSGFDRGHLVNSEDRGQSVEVNSSTFLMTNIVPQAPDNNQGGWEKLESYSRKLANQGKELYIIAGGFGTGGEGSNGVVSQLKGKVSVPETMWKVILVLDDPTKGLAGVTASTRTIAVLMPNKQGRNNKWQDFCVSVDDVEKLTGYDFFSNVPPDIQEQIESKKGC